MPDLIAKNFDTIVQDQAATVQATVDPTRDLLINFEEGSIPLAFCEANAGIALWLQGEALKNLAITRLATCVKDEDIFSFVEDFDMERLPAVSSTGIVNFARYTTDNEAKVLVGQVIETGDDHIKFKVVADTSNGQYDPINEWYLIPGGTANLDIKVKAVEAGTSGNVTAHAISIITTTINYVDTVNNDLAFTNGQAEETGEEIRARFPFYLQSLNKATKWALEAAIQSTQEGLLYSLTENKQYDTDNIQYGIFYAVVDDGSGAPPQSLLDQVLAALDRDRGFTIMPAVYAPEIIDITITLDALVDTAKYDEVEAKTTIETAVTAYVDSSQVGVKLYYNRLICVANDSYEGVQDIQNLILNSGTADIIPTNKQKVKMLSIVVNIVDTPS